VIAETDPEQPVAAVATMDEIVALDVEDRHQTDDVVDGPSRRFALLLASLGLYGLLAYTVSQRSREIGLRMALGASAARVVAMVVLRGVALACRGAGAGTFRRVAAGRRHEQDSFTASAATDPGTYGMVALLLWRDRSGGRLDSGRAARVRIDPIVVLREE